MRTLHVMVSLASGLVLVVGCSSQTKTEVKPEGKTLLAASTPVTFHPSGAMYAYSEGGVVAVKRVGEDHVYFLTRRPPAKKKKEAKKAKEEKKTQKPPCVPVPPNGPQPGPQGGWHGHPAWSPDGRFIAFSARWKDANCKDDDDQDWDIWLVDVSGLTPENLGKWVKELEPKNKKKPAKVKKYVLLGVEGKGFVYYQATRSAGAEHFPAWATCRKLAYRTRTRVLLKELEGLPGVCTREVEAAAGSALAAAPPCPCGTAGCAHAAHGGKPCPAGCPHAAQAGKPCPCGAGECPHAGAAAKPCPCKAGECPHAGAAGKPCPCKAGGCPHAGAAATPCPCGKAGCPHAAHAGKPCPAGCPHAAPPPGPGTRPSAEPRPAVRPRPARPHLPRPVARPAARPRPAAPRPAAD